MIRITDKSLCCGCTACSTVCPAQCIVMRRDREGFDYPVANPDLCIGCGRCESVCPVTRPLEQVHPMAAYAARIESNLMDSSSGGIFPALASAVIESGGVVYGAVLEPDMNVGHAEAASMDEVEHMRGSKYVQSDLYSTFEDVKARLEEGRKVLFTGTPCQVAGLKRYLDETKCASSDRTDLLTVDTACHGVPSPGLWRKYVSSLEERLGEKIVGVSFRDRKRGWRRYGLKAVTQSGKIYFMGREKDPFLSLFLQDMTLRPSCYTCKVRCGRSGSDMTLSDLWSVAVTVPAMDDDRGVSGVYVNSETGLAMLAPLFPDGVFVRVDADAARRDNGGFAESMEVPLRREEFFKGVHSARDLVEYMSAHVVRPPLFKRMFRVLRRWLSDINRRVSR